MQNKILKRLLMFLFIVVLITFCVLFVILHRYDEKMQTGGELHAIEIVGEYSEEGGSWLPLTQDVFFQNLSLRDIAVRGHFTRDLPKGIKLFLNIDHLYAILRVNGTEVFSVEPMEGDGNPTQAIGRQWVTVISPGISTTDMVELSFGNLYKNAHLIQFDELLWQMHTGDERMMLFEALRLDGWPLGIGTAFAFLTLFLLAICIGCAVMRIKGAHRFLWLGFTTFFATCWFYTLSSAPTLILPLPVLLNVLYAFSMQGMVIFLVLFASDRVTGWRKSSLGGIVALLLVVTWVALINQLLSVQDLYKAIDYFAVFDLLAVFWFVLCVSYEACKLKKRESVDFLKTMMPLSFFSMIELINGFVQFSKAAVFLGIGLVLFVVAEGIYMLRRIKQSMEGEKRALVLENELQQSHIVTMLSQIQPHFLYNSLQGIKLLCDTNPPKASEALEHFAFYLRGNLDSLVNVQLTPFEKELVHIRDYLFLEKLRFGGELNTQWDLECKDFLLPPLTVQPLVENAIRYGLNKKIGGGTLLIKSERIANQVIITVQDDGVGFDVTRQKADGRSHIGIENTRNRLSTLCGGTLLIDSEKDVGTTAKIILPQREVTM